MQASRIPSLPALGAPGHWMLPSIANLRLRGHWSVAHAALSVDGMMLLVSQLQRLAVNQVAPAKQRLRHYLLPELRSDQELVLHIPSPSPGLLNYLLAWLQGFGGGSPEPRCAVRSAPFASLQSQQPALRGPPADNAVGKLKCSSRS